MSLSLETKTDLYDQIAEKIKNNGTNINDLMEKCNEKCNVPQFHEKIIKTNSLNFEGIFTSVSNAEFYDLNQISNLFQLIESIKDSREENSKLITQNYADSRFLNRDIVRNPHDFCINKENDESLKISDNIYEMLNMIDYSPRTLSEFRKIGKNDEREKNALAQLVTYLQSISKELISTTKCFKINENLEPSLEINENFAESARQFNETLADIKELFQKSNEYFVIEEKKSSGFASDLKTVIISILNAAGKIHEQK
ncbi:CLUMA_CG000003, isoform A [Clunio marinus]|uniref:CLUMA_CG000003, isoform A n=1 Tax=Clunio marinus TaxID=568069 RepID=A0A1J1HFH3_9DIPT|nr:CLUMA_CG000003, isoform A [Clunio marinus]